MLPFLRHRPSLFIDKHARFEVTKLIRNLKLELISDFGLDPKLLYSADLEIARMLKRYINEDFHRFESLHVVPKHDSMLQVDFIKSNLKGYVFYFICQFCNRRVLHLYQSHEAEQLGCRTCYHFAYPKHHSKGAKLKKLLRNPDLLMNYLYSSPKHNLLAQEALLLLKKSLVELN